MIRQLLYAASYCTLCAAPNRFLKGKPGLNLGGGKIEHEDFLNLDLSLSVDRPFDLERYPLVIPPNSIERVVAISSLNYLSYERVVDLMFRVHLGLKNGGRLRVALQDRDRIWEMGVGGEFKELARRGNRYAVSGDFLLREYFSGFESSGSSCKFLYSCSFCLALIRNIGFSSVVVSSFLDPDSDLSIFDNRESEMFFIEATK